MLLELHKHLIYYVSNQFTNFSFSYQNIMCLKIFIQDKVAITANFYKDLCNFIVYKDICIDVYFTCHMSHGKETFLCVFYSHIAYSMCGASHNNYVLYLLPKVNAGWSKVYSWTVNSSIAVKVNFIWKIQWQFGPNIKQWVSSFQRILS